ncbi:MAG: chorismate mutase, partial [Bryobacteraceae bacterium]
SIEEAEAALDHCRKQIDVVDRQIVELLNQRARVVEVIGEVKQQIAMRVYEPKREELVYANVTGSNGGPLPSASVRRIYERIMDEMRTLQRDRMAARIQGAGGEGAS